LILVSSPLSVVGRWFGREWTRFPGSECMERLRTTEVVRWSWTNNNKETKLERL
jgi:hypothetical protein